ncbi:MAG: asparagine synthase-related protein [Patescibacteria group bacterium]
MARLVGMMACGRERELEELLKKKLHPGYKVRVDGSNGITLGMASIDPCRLAEGFTCDGRLPECDQIDRIMRAAASADRIGLRDALAGIAPPFALAAAARGHLLLARDPLGVKPLYLGLRFDGKMLLYASEIKLLTGLTRQILPLPPGTFVLDTGEPERFSALPGIRLEPGVDDAKWASMLRAALAGAVSEQGYDGCGILLSGGLDSATVAALAAEAGYRCEAFTVVYPGGRDQEYAALLVKNLGWTHHVCGPSLDDLVASLPEVIYGLESFDAPLVRSAVVNFHLNKLASRHVATVLCGEGSDELFAGYDYLKSISAKELHGELQKLLEELPAGGLQRADRMAHAHGLEPRVPFMAWEVVSLARRMPPEILIGPGGIDKWILRRAMEGFLPEAIVARRKEKFSVGCGSAEALAGFCEERISDNEYLRGKTLPDGSMLRSKEELFYYRIFKDAFGDGCLPLVSRTRH